jgi:hypothetical protein
VLAVRPECPVGHPGGAAVVHLVGRQVHVDDLEVPLGVGAFVLAERGPRCSASPCLSAARARGGSMAGERIAGLTRLN